NKSISLVLRIRAVPFSARAESPVSCLLQRSTIQLSPHHLILCLHQSARIRLRRHMPQFHVPPQSAKQRNPTPDQHRHARDDQPLNQPCPQKTLHRNPAVHIHMPHSSSFAVISIGSPDICSTLAPRRIAADKSTRSLLS